MNKFVSLSLVLVVLMFALNADAQSFRSFTVSAEDQNAVLNWTISNDLNVQHFVIQRSFDGNRFYNIATVASDGSGTYLYTDSDLFKESLNTYYYRVEINFRGGSTEPSQTQSVVISSSSVNRTWGSIKAMFR